MNHILVYSAMLLYVQNFTERRIANGKTRVAVKVREKKAKVKLRHILNIVHPLILVSEAQY
jgi:hypothetical protein